MHDHKLVTHKFLVTCKRKNNYPMEKLGKTFAKKIKINITQERQMGIKYLRNTYITFGVFWQGIHTLIFIFKGVNTKKDRG